MQNYHTHWVANEKLLFGMHYKTTQKDITIWQMGLSKSIFKL